jgi:hypothetical protein
VKEEEIECNHCDEEEKEAQYMLSPSNSIYIQTPSVARIGAYNNMVVNVEK